MATQSQILNCLQMIRLSSSVVQHIIISAKNLNEKINKQAFQWKMSFNLYSSKQAQEVNFPWKLNKPNHPTLNFHNTVVI